MAIETVHLPADAIRVSSEARSVFPFDKPRPNQIEALQWLMSGVHGCKDIILEAPTGIGKSAIAYGLARYIHNLTEEGTYIITHRKGLQEQYCQEFKLPTVMGRANYYCVADKGICQVCSLHKPSEREALEIARGDMADTTGFCLESPCTAAEAPCTFTPKFNCPQGKALVEGRVPKCPYAVAKKAVLDSPISVLGFDYLLLEHTLVGKFPRRGLLVVDEAHRIEERINRLINVRLSSMQAAKIWSKEALMQYKDGEIAGTLYWGRRKGNAMMEVIKGEKFLSYEDSTATGVVFDNKLPEHKLALDWVEWLFESAITAEAKALDYETEIEGMSKHLAELDATADEEEIKQIVGLISKNQRKANELHHLSGKCHQLSKLIFERPQNWLVEFEQDEKDFTKKRVEFRPIYVEQQANEILDGIARRRMYMSATIVDVESFAQSLGIKDAFFVRIDSSPFPVENRQVHYRAIGSMVRRNIDEATPIVLKEIERLVFAKHPDVRVLVLPYNNKLQAATYNHLITRSKRRRFKFPDGYISQIAEWLSRNQAPRRWVDVLMEKALHLEECRILTHTPRKWDRDITMRLYEACPDAVLISTYWNEGFDGHDDLCRALIIPKIPYPSLSDPAIAIRARKSPKWYQAQTVLTLMQQLGRAVRSETDYASMYVLDAEFGRLFNRNREMFPGWLQEAIVEEEVEANE